MSIFLTVFERKRAESEMQLDEYVDKVVFTLHETYKDRDRGEKLSSFFKRKCTHFLRKEL